MTWNSAEGLDLRKFEFGGIVSATRIDLDGTVTELQGLELDRWNAKDGNDRLYIKNLLGTARNLTVDLWVESIREEVLGPVDGAVRVCGDQLIIYVEEPPDILEVRVEIESGPERRAYYREEVRRAKYK